LPVFYSWENEEKEASVLVFVIHFLRQYLLEGFCWL